MRHRSFLSRIFVPIAAATCLTLCSCGEPTNTDPSPETSSSSDTASSESEIIDASNSAKVGSRDCTPVVLIGSADGASTLGNESVTIDVSHTDDGYLMVNYTGSNPKVKFQVTGPDQVAYTYNLHGGYETFPLTAGNGSYTLGVFEFIEGTTYSTLFTQNIEVAISNEFGPYLYANQYVDFSSSSTVVDKGSQLARPADSDLEVVENVYNFISTNFTYDYDKAATVESGYLPVVDEVYAAQSGICFDYAAVMATMLRTQNIPTRLEVGYMEDVYHAWISVYISGEGWINGIIQFNGNEWNLMDPTFASTSGDPVDYITETDSYLTKYVY